MDSPARVGRLRNRLAARLSLGAKIAWLLSLLTLFTVGAVVPRFADAFLSILGIAAFGGFVAMALSWLVSLRSGTGPGHVTFHDGVLRVKRGKHFVAFGAPDITSAHAQPGGLVEVETRTGDRWLLEMENAEDAETLVGELGYAPGGKPVTYAFASRYRRFLHVALATVSYQLGALVGGVIGIVLTALLGAPFLMGPLVVLAFVLAYAVLKRAISPPVVTVGNDGVWIRTYGIKKRFIPIADIVMAHQTKVGGPVRIKLRDGSFVHMAGFLVDPARRDAAAIHIRTLLARHAAMQKTSVALAREGRSVKEWREHLRRVVEGAGYRVAQASDSLADVVTAPGVTPEERIGAALALRVSGKDAVPRIRIAAEQCVDPKTRIALEAAALDEIDEAAIEKALA